MPYDPLDDPLNLDEIILDEATDEERTMSNKREYILTQEGAIMRRDVSEYEIDVSAELISRLTREHVTKISNIGEVPGAGPVGVSVSNGVIYYTVSLSRLIIRAPWRLIDNSFLAPTFGSKSDPVMTVTWNPPANCQLRFVVLTSQGKKSVAWAGSWIFAQDAKGVVWRMPIANVHDDCSCCSGLNGMEAANGLALMQKMVENFDQSNYNADLLKNSEYTQQFFRVKQEKEGFVTVPPATEWTTLCIKVASNVANAIA